MFYVVSTATNKTLHYNTYDVEKILKEFPNASVRTFRTRVEAINYIKQTEAAMIKPITATDSHVLYVDTILKENCVFYKGRVVTIDGKTHEFENQTSEGVVNPYVAELMACWSVLTAFPSDKVYFVTKMPELVQTYRHHCISPSSKGSDPVANMCREILDFMASRHTIISTSDPLIRT